MEFVRKATVCCMASNGFAPLQCHAADGYYCNRTCLYEFRSYKIPPLDRMSGHHLLHVCGHEIRRKCIHRVLTKLYICASFYQCTSFLAYYDAQLFSLPSLVGSEKLCTRLGEHRTMIAGNLLFSLFSVLFAVTSTFFSSMWFGIWGNDSFVHHTFPLAW